MCDKYSLFPAELLSLVFVTEDLLPKAIWEETDTSLEDPSENPETVGFFETVSIFFSFADSDAVDPKENPVEAGFEELNEEAAGEVSGFDFSLETAEPNMNPEAADDFTLSLSFPDFTPKPNPELVAAGFGFSFEDVEPVPKLKPEVAELEPVAVVELPKEKPLALAGASPNSMLQWIPLPLNEQDRLGWEGLIKQVLLCSQNRHVNKFQITLKLTPFLDAVASLDHGFERK